MQKLRADRIVAPFSVSELIQINIQLKMRFGTELDGRPRYRVVWANDEKEKRFGTYNVYSSTGYIYLRTETGVKEVDKYPIATNRYVLERLLYYPMQEVIGSENGVYESVWIFQDAKDNYLPPNWYVCERICRLLEAPKEKQSEKDWVREEQKKKDKEIDEDTDRLGEEGHRWWAMSGETGRQGHFLDSREHKSWVRK